ncbi:MAG: phosphoglucosamine mutase [Ruminococcus sp.]|nr:phosphoglucosamine mutase [Ruminococcus sp.]MBQ8121815.1 phosphoglucosamine mutase [Ruminococcus sp.]
MSRLFGKEGIRGVAVTELTAELCMQIGRAAAAVMEGNSGEKTRILIGKDTRSSSDTLEAALCAGICSAGADAELLGVVPAPALAYLIGVHEADGGIMITAAHVGAEFGGMKLFSSYGHRLSDEDEEEIERLVTVDPAELKPIPRRIYGNVIRCENALSEYLEHIKSLSSADLSGMKIAVDCANGCASSTAKDIFTGMGAEVVLMGSSPDGTNINLDCGSTHIDRLMEFVKENECDCGLAFDGAAERCLAVDENGRLADGDELIAICAKHMKDKGTLRHNTLVVTASNNLGLLHFARENGIYTVQAGSAGRYLHRKMLEGGFSIGGDPGGQIIFPDDAPSADGQLTGIKLLEILKESGGRMSQLTGVIKKLPQVMINVRISPKDREIWKNDRAITGLIDEFEEILGEDGRIIVREAGRSPVIRIMVEGEDFTTINTMAIQVADTIKERCGQ